MKNIYLIFSIILVDPKYIECANVDKQNNFSNENITNTEENDGFGSQFQNIIGTVIYAELNNKKYLYTPFKKIAHNYNSEIDFIKKKERLINFLDNFEINENNIAIPQIGCKDFFDQNITKCSNSLSLNKIKKIFRANKNINNYFNNNKNLHIAIHVRRPNQHDCRIEGTNTPNNFFLNIIDKLRVIYLSKDPLFHIYSQGDIENFKIFKASDVILHINESIEDTFTSMVLADVLVTSISSFSHTAGLLSDGIVYYIPFWHAPLPNWIKVDDLK